VVENNRGIKKGVHVKLFNYFGKLIIAKAKMKRKVNAEIN
jgi:hypothetical protein